MSYARFGWDGSDVYVILHVGGYLCCYDMAEDRDFYCAYSVEEMFAHLREHQAAGDFVPDYTFQEIEEDRGDIEALIAEVAAKRVTS